MRVIGATSLRFPPRASAPANPVVGDTYYNTTDGNLYLWDGGWQALDAAAGPGGSADVKQTEVDFGTTPRTEQSFVVTDAGATATSQILASQAYAAATGRDADENEMDPLHVIALPGAGQFTLLVRGLEGKLEGPFKINYQIG